MKEINKLKSVNINDLTAEETLALQRKLQKFNGVGKMIKSTLVEGMENDYASIPGCGNKPTLLLPGARKIVLLFGLSADFHIVKSEVNFEKNFFHYIIETKLVNGAGEIVSSGIGSCSNKERGKENMPDNSILKIAKKRSYVDAALGVTAISNVFTQDLEDLPQTRKVAAAPKYVKKVVSSPVAPQTPPPVVNTTPQAQQAPIIAEYDANDEINSLINEAIKNNEI